MRADSVVRKKCQREATEGGESTCSASWMKVR